MTALAIAWMFLPQGLAAQTKATFGTVVQLRGTPSDIVLDESRNRLYLVNAADGNVSVYDYSAQAVVATIAVGPRPLSAAMSLDNRFLYVANHDSSSLSVVDLSGGFSSSVSLPAQPEGVEVGADGRVLISTDGSQTSSLTNTLLIYDGTQASQYQVLPVAFPTPPATPSTLPLLTARITTQFNGALKRTPDGAYIVGVSEISNNTSTVVYVYQVATGTVIQNRYAVGQSSTFSMAPDGLSFMAGFTLYDTLTLNVLAQQSTANAPFATTSSFSTTFNVGGSAFSPDGTTLYSAFNTAALTTPAPAPQASTLLISDGHNLAINLGINLPQSITGKIVITSDGSQAWALSQSGMIYLPLSTLYTYPILMPSSTNVFVAQNDCNPGLATGTVQITNIGGGTLTFAISTPTAGVSAALIAAADSGLAPANVTFTMDPGRSGVIRTPGTNLYTGAGSSNTGTAVQIQLVSPEAINVPPTLLVYMNYRDSSMRGLIFPVQVAPNSTAAAYQGLWDIALDEPRNRIYISNPGYNRIEVFDTQQLQFLNPIPVGSRPHQMAMGLDGSTLYVAHNGGEPIAVVDLNQQQVTGTLKLPPIPRAGNANVDSVVTMMEGLAGLQFVLSSPTSTSTAANVTGTLWEAIMSSVAPRVGTAITGVSATGAQTVIAAPTQAMQASSDGTTGILLGGNGTAYLYSGLSDTYTASQQLFTTPIIGYYGAVGASPHGSYLLANGLIMDNSLSVIGGAASPGQVTITPGAPGGPGGFGGPPTIGISSTGARNVAAVAPVDDNVLAWMTTPVRTSLTSATSDDIHTTLQTVDTQSGTITNYRMPENPVLSEFGTARTAVPPHQMVVDSQGTVYALTVSGLSVVPLASAPAPQFAGPNSIVNSNDGTTNFAPGSFITVNGVNLASSATAATLPPPTQLGGSCVLVDDVAIPLLATAPGQISAQLPASLQPGVNVLEVRSLLNAHRSAPLKIMVQEP
jgi:WD40 repeat protein